MTRIVILNVTRISLETPLRQLADRNDNYMVHIVKRKGHKEVFDIKKVYGSVFAASLAVPMQHEEAELVARDVSEKIEEWVKDKEEVASNQIFEQIGKELKDINKHATTMYIHHRDLS